MLFFFFSKAEDGIRFVAVTGVQTCALPICHDRRHRDPGLRRSRELRLRLLHNQPHEPAQPRQAFHARERVRAELIPVEYRDCLRRQLDLVHALGQATLAAFGFALTAPPYFRRFDPSSECFTTLSGTVSPCRTVNTAFRLNPRSTSTTR